MTLPVRYLGVPLCTKKLTIANFEVLIQQVKSKFTSWNVKTLSFAGRFLLIKMVIAGITNYWCSTFLLPNPCVKRINSQCGLFLWKGRLDAHHSATVSWEVVTKEKSCGGLGVKDLLTWNKACCIKLIWLLFFQAGSIWVGWLKTEVLKGSLSNLWTMRPSTTNSWLVNKLFKLRDEFYTWIKMQVGNGESCRLWSDNWSPFGKISQYLLSDQTSRMGISSRTTVADLFVDGNWRLPPLRSESMLQLHIFFTTLALTETEDHYEWIVNDKPSSRFSTSEIYRKLRDREKTVPWAFIVWIGRGIPRHNFLTWLFILNRCPTRDRLISWGLQTDAACLLCIRLLNQGTTCSIFAFTAGQFGKRSPEDVTCNRFNIGIKLWFACRLSKETKLRRNLLCYVGNRRYIRCGRRGTKGYIIISIVTWTLSFN